MDVDRSPPHLPVLGLLVIALALGGGGCAPADATAEDPGPRWTQLARDFVPPLALARPVEGIAADLRVVPEGSDAWLEGELRPEDWVGGELGLWVAPVPWRGIGRRRPEGSLSARCRMGSRELVGIPGRKPRLTEETAPGSFHYDGRLLRLWLAPSEGPPGPVTFGVFAGKGRKTSDGTWRLAGLRRAVGIPVWPGERVERRVVLGGSDALSFTVYARSARTDPAGSAGEPLVFRVLCDGEPIADVRAPEGGMKSQRVALPSRHGAATLSFTVEGPFAYTAFLEAQVTPLEIGTFGDRPWGETRPDVVVFQADTLRADALGAYGSTLGLTPEIDAFAGECVVYSEARSNASYTLPAHASLFTGLHPRRAGIVGRTMLASGLVTLAQHFRAHGYRTVAITDGGLVSATYGFDRGFEWFDEQWGLAHAPDAFEATRRRCELVFESDDGRPLFLFVQTYRAHSPYRVTEDTRQRLADRLDLSADFDELSELLDREGRTPELLERLRSLYLGGVADLDVEFGGFLDLLRAEGLWDEAIVLFLSDHGEAFGEHGHVEHGGVVHGELIRIPLLLRAPGLEPRVDPRAASLVDVFPTLVDLIGLEPPRTPHPWHGSSLVGPPSERPVYAFQAKGSEEDASVAVLFGDRKLIVTEADVDAQRPAIASFELGTDPGELRDLGPVPWAVELLEDVRPELEGCLEPATPAAPVELGAEELRELEALGYGAGFVDPPR